jgi:hypothetical protein
MIDHLLLLKKYMRMVLEWEGTTFVDSVNCTAQEFTEEEALELRAIATLLDAEDRVFVGSSKKMRTYQSMDLAPLTEPIAGLTVNRDELLVRWSDGWHVTTPDGDLGARLEPDMLIGWRKVEEEA